MEVVIQGPCPLSSCRCQWSLLFDLNLPLFGGHVVHRWVVSLSLLQKPVNPLHKELVFNVHWFAREQFRVFLRKLPDRHLNEIYSTCSRVVILLWSILLLWEV